MITSVDTNVVLDVLIADPTFGPASHAALQRCSLEGSVVACAVVWAELASQFRADAECVAALGQLRIVFSSIDRAIAIAAGVAFGEYRRRGGARGRMVPDFLIAAHASARADRLLTRDRGFHRAYFGGLQLIEPQSR